MNFLGKGRGQKKLIIGFHSNTVLNKKLLNTALLLILRRIVQLPLHSSLRPYHTNPPLLSKKENCPSFNA